MTQPNQSELDECTDDLDKLLEKVYLYGMNGGLGYGKFENELSPKEAKQAIYKDLLELIEEDEVGFYNRTDVPITDKDINWFAEWAEVVAQNKLRQELRTKLKDYFGETND